MKKQMIEIEVPDGKKAVWKDGKVVFEDIEPQLPNTWEEFCKNYPIKSGEFLIDSLSQILAPGFRDREINVDQNVLPNYKAADAHLAHMQLHQLRDCYRQGWEPEVDKWSFAIIRSVDGRLDVDRFMYSSRFLSFQSEEIAEKFLHNFRDYIKRADDLI